MDTEYRIRYFFCRSSHLLQEMLIQKISNVINIREDQFIIINLGSDENILDQAIVLGKKIIKFPKITFV